MLRKMTMALIVAAAMGSGTAAYAHPALKAAIPSANGVVSQKMLKEMRFTFSESVVPVFSGAKVTDLKGNAIVTAKAYSDAKNKKILVVPLKAKLAPGAYQVAWFAVASDTHRVKGNYAFTVK